MNQHLQAILNSIQQSDHLSNNEKDDLLKSLKDANKELEITAFKLDRTEKVKRTTAILLEETIEELEQKRKAVEKQNRELEIETSIERVRAQAMAMRQTTDLDKVNKELFNQLQWLKVEGLSGVSIYFIDEEGEVKVWDLSSFGNMGDPNSYAFKFSSKKYPILGELWLHVKNIQEDYFTLDYPLEKMKAAIPEFREIDTVLANAIEAAINSGNLKHQWNAFGRIANGVLGIDLMAPPSEDTKNIVLKMAGAFNLAYNRFLDLQKAEAQTKESQIQLALERVRARTMAMQHSNELAEVSSVLFQQIKELGFETWSCGFCIWSKDDLVEVWMGADSGGLLPAMYIPYKEEPTHHDVYKAHLRDIQPYNKIWEGKALEKHYAFLKTIPSVKEAIDMLESSGLSLPERQCYYVGFFKQGYLLLITKDPNAELKDLSNRFAKVFEQTYTRFLDLQKAEAQARESQIQLALERVRARTMAMQHSDELADASFELDSQVRSLGIKTWGCAFNIYGKNESTEWFSSEMGTMPAYKTPRENVFLRYYEAGQAGEAIHIETFEGDACAAHYDYLCTLPVMGDALRKVKESGGSFPVRQIDHVTYFKYGYLLFITLEPVPEVQDVFIRFAKVFEQTYTRFLDLQKAEEQAREAQIELGLERVRARAMAMQTSEELNALIGIVFTELTKLDLVLTRCVIIIYDAETKGAQWWMANSEAPSAPMNFSVKYANLPFFNMYLEGWEERDLKWQYLLEGENKIVTDNFLFNETELKTLPDFVIEGMKAPHKIYLNASFNNFGNLTLATLEPLSEKHFDILLRFAKVFDLTYTRFNDLQKAEEQAREAEIELALERVRARTMGMQHSDELPEAANLLFLQVQNLGIPAWSCGYNIFSADKKSSTCIMSSEGQLQEPFVLPLSEHESLLPWYKAIISKKEFFVYGQGGKALVEHYDYMKSLPELKATFKQLEETGLALPTRQFNHLVRFPEGFLLFITYEEVPKSHDIFKRFGKVFQQTYTRFLDLQKAEAQAKEAKIEAALERVRARTMAMYKSENLSAVAEVVFNELEKLELGLLRCGIGIINKENRSADAWITSVTDEGKTVQVSGTESMDLPPLLQGVYNAWLTNSDFSYLLEGEDLVQYYKTSGTGKVRLPDSQLILSAEEITTQYYHIAVFEAGGLFAFSANDFPEEAKMVMKRFADVFNQSYTRFLDLQKAEAQTREAKIEASLEKVRGKAMAMHNSSDLLDVINLLASQFQTLGFKIHSANFNTSYREKDWNLWLYNSGTPVYPEQIHIPYLDHPFFNRTLESIAKGSDFTSLVFTKEEKDGFLDHLYANTIAINAPEERKKNSYSAPGFAWSTVYLKNTALTIANYDAEPYTEEQNKIIRRFGGVFEQTYTRFLDLQKAEAQAKESQIEAALERVRSRTLAMQKSDELAETAAVLFNQLVQLGIEPNRLYIGIIKDNNGQIEFWATDEEGSTVSTQFIADASRNASMKKMYDAWKAEKKSLTIDMQGKELNDYFQYMADELKVPFAKGLSQKRRIQNIAIFGKGFLGTASPDEQPGETMLLLERFAAVFNLTYTRFNDLQIAEAHALQSEKDLIEIKAARKKAEETLTELQSTQKQLIQSEKMASLGELTAGIAHEIQNPLNFVNNFSEVSAELIDEMKEELSKANYEEANEIANDLKQNLEKINHHGKRAGDIVKGMLQHSRASTGAKEPTDINALADEYLRLAYHGLRAKDKTFNATLKTDYDETLGLVKIIPQDMGRVILNLITNAFYAVDEKKKSGSDINQNEIYEPTVSISTKKPGNKIEIKVTDNGNGIPQNIIDKIFQPFFTTKPTGQGTGLGLSLAYDIVKTHGGELKVESKEGEGTEFIIQLPV